MTSKYLIFVVYFLFYQGLQIGWAQKKDSISVKKDSIAPKVEPKKPLAITGVRIGLDIVPPIIVFLDSRFKNYEASGEILLNRKYYLIGEIGTAQNKRLGENYTYQSAGSYIRLGVDYNFWKTGKQNVQGLATLGFRYCFGTFNQSLDYNLNSTYWGNYKNRIDDRNLTTHWLEFVSSIKAQVFKNFFIGPILRIKVQLSVSKTDLMEIHDIPGYGINNFARIQPGYQILYRIPFRKDK